MSAVKGSVAEYNWKGERLVHVSQSQDVYDSQMWWYHVKDKYTLLRLKHFPQKKARLTALFKP